MQHPVPANAQVLSIYSKTTCPVAGMAEQARKAIDVCKSFDGDVDIRNKTIVDASYEALRNLEDAASFMLASAPEGAMFQVCALLSSTDNALDYMDEEGMRHGAQWVRRLRSGLYGLLQFLENHHGIDRSELSLDWYSSRKIQDIHFPIGAAV